MRIWKAYHRVYEQEYLVAVVEAETEPAAIAKVQELHFGDLPPTPPRIEAAVATGPPQPLRVRVGKILELDAGTCIPIADSERELRVVLAPRQPMFDQVVQFLLRQPAPPASWTPRLKDEGAAAARLVFRWGSYFAVIGDAMKPEWNQGISLGIGRYSNQEQARMNIEISSNMESVYHLQAFQPEVWRHLVYAARRLPGPKPVDSSVTAVGVYAVLKEGRDAVAQRMWKKLNLPSQPHPTEKPLDQETRDAFEENPIRRIMNVVALATWRVPLEDFHGDQRDAPYDRPPRPLDQRRFTMEELHELENRMAMAGNGLLETALELYGRSEQDICELLARPTVQSEAGQKWSLTERTRNVILW